MWRIWALIATGDKSAFLMPDGKNFDKDRIVAYCHAIGLALSDTGEKVVREKGNASDAHLRVEKPRDFGLLLEQIPLCHDVALTGEKAVATLGSIVGFKTIGIGEFVETDHFCGRNVRIWRMPSSSRAYPRPIEWKADYYRRMLEYVNAHNPIDNQNQHQ